MENAAIAQQIFDYMAMLSDQPFTALEMNMPTMVIGQTKTVYVRLTHRTDLSFHFTPNCNYCNTYTTGVACYRSANEICAFLNDLYLVKRSQVEQITSGYKEFCANMKCTENFMKNEKIVDISMTFPNLKNKTVTLVCISSSTGEFVYHAEIDEKYIVKDEPNLSQLLYTLSECMLYKDRVYLRSSGIEESGKIFKQFGFNE